MNLIRENRGEYATRQTPRTEEERKNLEARKLAFEASKGRRFLNKIADDICSIMGEDAPDDVWEKVDELGEFIKLSSNETMNKLMQEIVALVETSEDDLDNALKKLECVSNLK